MNWKRIGFFLVVLFAFGVMGCTEDEMERADAAGKVEPARPDVKREKKPPTFPELVPEMRKQVREASLQKWVKVPDDLPFYKIRVKFDTDFMTYEGKLELWVKNRSKDEWKELSFHLYPNFPAIAGDLKYLKITKAVVGDREVDGRDLGARFELPLETPLKPGEDTHVALDIAGLVKRLKVGGTSGEADIWKQMLDLMSDETGDYGIFAYSSGIMSLALWYPVLAAYDENGWDVATPDDIGDFSYFQAADYLVEVEMEDTFSTITTGNRLSREGNVTSFGAGAVREFTLIASKQLHSLTRKVGAKGEVVVNSFALQAGGDTHNLTLHTAADAMQVFEKLFGPYPYRELDVVQTDLLAGVGGVEFPGLVTIASLLYFDSWKDITEETEAVCDSRFMREATQFVVAHEVAHQWWNAVVGSHSRNHPFLDEALANYSAILFFEERYGAEAAERQSIFELKLPYQIHRFMGGEDMAVDLPAREFTDLMDYSVIVYPKGGLFLKAMRELISSDTFIKAMSSYYDRYMFDIASPDDLVSRFGRTAGKETEVRELAERWLSGSHGDEDIGSFQPGEVIPLLLRELGVELDGWILEIVGEEGFWELVKVGSNILDGKTDILDGVDFDELVSWLTKMTKKILWDVLL